MVESLAKLCDPSDSLFMWLISIYKWELSPWLRSRSNHWTFPVLPREAHHSLTQDGSLTAPMTCSSVRLRGLPQGLHSTRRTQTVTSLRTSLGLQVLPARDSFPSSSETQKVRRSLNIICVICCLCTLTGRSFYSLSSHKDKVMSCRLMILVLIRQVTPLFVILAHLQLNFTPKLQHHAWSS